MPSEISRLLDSAEPDFEAARRVLEENDITTPTMGLQNKGLVSKAQWLIAVLAATAIVVTLSSSHQSSTMTNVHQAHETPEWDKDYHAWEDALFQQGQQQNAAAPADFELLGKSKTNDDDDDDDDDHGKLNKLLYLNHSYAFDLLKTNDKKSTSNDFYNYQQGWEAQINQAYCGVAASAAVLNSLRGKITLPQDPLYIPFPWATQTQLVLEECVRSKVYDVDKMQHVFYGLGLEMTEQLLNCHLQEQGYTATAYHVDPSQVSKKEVRAAIVGALMDDDSRVFINYDRGGISQGDWGHGHFSPIGAYHHDLDAFLVMDVAKYKYPPVWVPTSNLMGGIGSVDQCSFFTYPDAPLDQSQDFIEIISQLGCQSAYRGFMIIKPTTD
jgi:hypothetical protein